MLLKVKPLLEMLHQIQYVLFGALGAIAYGADLSTRDMDICFATDEINRQHIAELLRTINARPTFTPGWNTEEECEAWQPEPLTIENLDHEFTTPYGKLDIVPYSFGPNGKADRFNYEQLKQRATTLYPFDIPVDVAHIEEWFTMNFYEYNSGFRQATRCRGWNGMKRVSNKCLGKLVKSSLFE